MDKPMEEKNIELTPEYKEKLKNVLGFKVDTTFPYVPKDYRSPENDIPKPLWPVFILRSKDGLEIAKVEDKTGVMYYDTDSPNRAQMNLHSGSVRIETLSMGIVAIKNFYIEDGSVLSFDQKLEQIKIKNPDGTEKVKKSTVKGVIKYMTTALQTELQNAINERSQLTEEELSGLEF